MLQEVSSINDYGFVVNAVRNRYRPTLVVALISGKNVLLVQSSKDALGQTWILPQDAIRNEDIADATARVCQKELSLTVDELCIDKLKVLGEGVNPIPAERKKRDGLRSDKLLVFVAVPFDRSARINLNSEESSRHTLVSNQYELWTRMGSVHAARPKKFYMTCAALTKAHHNGMLPWSCEPIMEELKRSA